MHLFSGHSSQTTPATTPSRPYSPSAQKRPIQLGSSTLPRRPGLLPRSSSLSAASLASSTESLPATVRLPNGSNLRKELAGASTADAPDPVEVLASILGPLRQDGRANGTNGSVVGERPETLVGDVEFGDLSLEEFASTEVQTAATSQDASEQNVTSIEDFEKERDKFEDLHKSIQACDNVLGSVEANLTTFRNDLALVSADIENLQARSEALNDRLENRKAVEKGLGPIVEELSISPAVVAKISEGHIDEQWVQALKEMDKRANSYRNSSHLEQSKALADLGPLLEKLRIKVKLPETPPKNTR